jgi:hypothetical protein
LNATQSERRSTDASTGIECILNLALTISVFVRGKGGRQ